MEWLQRQLPCTRQLKIWRQKYSLAEVIGLVVMEKMFT